MDATYLNVNNHLFYLADIERDEFSQISVEKRIFTSVVENQKGRKNEKFQTWVLFLVISMKLFSFYL